MSEDSIKSELHLYHTLKVNTFNPNHFLIDFSKLFLYVCLKLLLCVIVLNCFFVFRTALS